MRANYFLRTVACAVIIVCFASIAVSDDKAGNKTSQVNDPVETKFGELAKAQSLLGKSIAWKEGKAIGKVNDFVFDLETGDAALVVVGIPSENDITTFVALPWRVLSAGRDGFVIDPTITEPLFSKARKFDASKLPTLFNRAWAVVEYSTFGSKPYWAESKLADLPEFDVSNYRLSLLSDLKHVSVQGRDGNTMGSIDDFAISLPLGRIAYAALKLTDDKSNNRYPVPLGAFVVARVEDPWKVELDQEAIQNSPTLNVNQWPAKLDRRWIEYIHVRYGQSPLSGVQHKDKE